MTSPGFAFCGFWNAVSLLCHTVCRSVFHFCGRFPEGGRVSMQMGSFFFICELSTCYVTTFYMNCEAQKSFRRYLQKGNMLLETACQRLTKGGRGRVLVILPLLIVSIHFLLLLYPFQCDQPQFCVAGQAQGQLLESTGDWEARCWCILVPRYFVKIKCYMVQYQV